MSFVDRLLGLRELYKTVSFTEFYTSLHKITAFWSSLPSASSNVDVFSPSTWIISTDVFLHNAICNNMSSIMVFYTIVMCMPHVDVELIVIENKKESVLAVLVDTRYILNYNNERVMSKKDLKDKIVRSFSKSEILPFIKG